MDGQPAPRPFLRQGLADCCIVLSLFKYLSSVRIWHLRKFGNLNIKYLYLKRKGTKCIMPGNFVCFFFWKMFVEVLLLDPCGWFEVYLGLLNGILNGTG